MIKLAIKFSFNFKQIQVDLESLLSQVESILLTSVTPRSTTISDKIVGQWL